MTLGGFSENTKSSYLNSVIGLVRHYRRSPGQISAKEVQDYLIHLHQEKGLSWRSCNCARHAIRLLYRVTLGRPDPHFYLPGAKTPSTLPSTGSDMARARPPGRIPCAVRAGGRLVAPASGSGCSLDPKTYAFAARTRASPAPRH